jgi:hypothetical protein
MVTKNSSLELGNGPLKLAGTWLRSRGRYIFEWVIGTKIPVELYAVFVVRLSGPLMASRPGGILSENSI